MTVNLTPAQEERLLRLAASFQRTPDELAQEAVDGYLEHIEDLTVAIREGEESAERDGWIPHEEVVARVDKRFPKSA